ncbi:MAG: cyclic nucleotide-binding domain-containing protein [Desulfobacterales bacterium]|jgi:CRP-like cAMP-binding protein
MEDYADFLSGVSIFSLLKKVDLQRIAKLAQRHLFQSGDLIIKEGDRDRRLFVIISGTVEIIKDLGSENERQLGILGPPSYFGEMSLIDDLVRSASVISKGETELLSLDQWDLRNEIEKYPAIAFELLQMLSRRVRAIEKRMINTLGTFLPICAHCKRIRESNGSWTPIEKYITDRSETEFSHTICKDCTKKLYPHLRRNR